MDNFRRLLAELDEIETLKRQQHEPYTLYCLCGREFPQGEVSRLSYGNVQYADNRCPECCKELSDGQARELHPRSH